MKQNSNQQLIQKTSHKNLKKRVINSVSGDSHGDCTFTLQTYPHMTISDFKSSRISWPNNIFPAFIQISREGVTFNKSGFLSATARTIPFSSIRAVKLKCQFLGFSTITIQGDGNADIHAGGFTKLEVRSMKKLILGYLHKL